MGVVNKLRLFFLFSAKLAKTAAFCIHCNGGFSSQNAQGQAVFDFAGI
jgi:hypothetical protein